MASELKTDCLLRNSAYWAVPRGAGGVVAGITCDFVSAPKRSR